MSQHTQGEDMKSGFATPFLANITLHPLPRGLQRIIVKNTIIVKVRIALQIAQEGSSQAMNFEQNEMAVRSKVLICGILRLNFIL